MSDKGSPFKVLADKAMDLHWKYGKLCTMLVRECNEGWYTSEVAHFAEWAKATVLVELLEKFEEEYQEQLRLAIDAIDAMRRDP